ncbi:hypothetical protein DM02DRAFT_196883 [Periconia macrospinosa]|uniref:Histone deacetylase complex subunit SAP30 Sin3 binding domain-containing protein n=1 Tax=Periconia macrospinosa TaxID=97972 RepID=A0A2V1D832_9PLEO|nr:hypothetical protein DM02DRAFT_196883 [Periconia macrospinosa]
MPPSKRTQEDPQSLKEKLHSLQGTGARGRRNGNANTANGSNLKDVMSSNGDNASTNSGQNEHTSGTRWDTQDITVLQSYRRAYRLDTQPAFKNPLSHVVLNQGIGRFSPTMSRPKSKTRVEKSQLALAVRKNFNAQAVSETNCIVDWIYTVKNQDKEFRVRFAPPRK